MIWLTHYLRFFCLADQWTSADRILAALVKRITGGDVGCRINYAGIYGTGDDTNSVFFRYGFVWLADAVFGGAFCGVVGGSDSLFQAKDFTSADRSCACPFGQG